MNAAQWLEKLKESDEETYMELSDVQAILDDGRVQGMREAGQRKCKVVCLCGSSRFVDVMAVEAWNLEKQGIMVLSPHLLPAWYPGVQEHHQAEAESVAHILDELHERKIDMADEILVVNCNGYIGDRTKVEIAYAKEHGKPVRFLEPMKDHADKLAKGEK